MQTVWNEGKHKMVGNTKRVRKCRTSHFAMLLWAANLVQSSKMAKFI